MLGAEVCDATSSIRLVGFGGAAAIETGFVVIVIGSLGAVCLCRCGLDGEHVAETSASQCRLKRFIGREAHITCA
jgi:hypothetical protein